MSRGKYPSKCKMKLALEVLCGERGLDAIAEEHNLNSNMQRNRKTGFLGHASIAFEELGKTEREAKRKAAAVKKAQDKILKTIGQLTIECYFLQDCFRAVGQHIPEFDPENTSEMSVHRQCELLHSNRATVYAPPSKPNEEKPCCERL